MTAGTYSLLRLRSHLVFVHVVATKKLKQDTLRQKEGISLVLNFYHVQVHFVNISISAYPHYLFSLSTNRT